MSPVELSPAPASSTLWAQPSKEWVIPARPRPGRKPKREPTSGPTEPKDDPDEESASRRVQNRAAQRAFRERKQIQLAELQARLHSYEQGEIERNVALQTIAKKMKEENEELHRENQILKEKIARLGRERDELLSKDKKRAYDDTATSSPTCFPADYAPKKRVRVDGDKLESPPVLLPSFSPSASSASSLDAAPPAAPFSPGGHEDHSRHSIFLTPPPINDLPFTTAHEAASASASQDPIGPYTCVLCSPDAPCICREVTLQHDISNDSHHRLPLQRESLSQSIASLDQLDQPMRAGSPPTAGTSILDNLPAFQAPLPIRRKTGTSRANPVFPVTPTATASLASASKCSGDPDNCMACADDNFGKAFCQAIGHTVNSSLPCLDCPKRTNQTGEILVGGCCGDISKCGSCGIAPIIPSTVPPHGPETIPTDDAWRQLKSHPNVAFADLSLLAEVVARRSKCNGSRVVISPAPGSVTPDRNIWPSHHEPAEASEDQPILLTEHCRQKQKQRESPPQLVPQHVLIECGRRRVKEVNADGVREALRLLDQKFAHMR